jgi:hypothetical protein
MATNSDLHHVCGIAGFDVVRTQRFEGKDDIYIRITSGLMEATNNKVRVLQRQTYGAGDRQYFKLNITSSHKKKCA